MGAASFITSSKLRYIVAAGDASICPPKLQLTGKYMYPAFVRSIDGTAAMYKDYNAYLQNKPCVFGGDNLYMFGALRNAFPEFQKLSIAGDNITDDSCVFTDVVTTLPYLKVLTVSCYTNNNWINEVLQLQNHSMERLVVYFTTSQFEVFSFYDLLKMLKAQQPGFRLIIKVEDKIGKFKIYFSQLKQFFDIHVAQGCSAVKGFTEFRLCYPSFSTMYSWHIKKC
uniref:ANF_receptor domain-containing protein n=1 Tax=Panagrellus redivivus TaxID=6233 RepID=A0A7E4ZS19_PANRE